VRAIRAHLSSISKICGEGESRISGYRSISAESICGSQAVVLRFLSNGRVSAKRKQSIRATRRLVVEVTARLRLPGNGPRGDQAHASSKATSGPVMDGGPQHHIRERYAVRKG
jgi:hypothetical protein